MDPLQKLVIGIGIVYIYISGGSGSRSSGSSSRRSSVVVVDDSSSSCCRRHRSRSKREMTIDPYNL